MRGTYMYFGNAEFFSCQQYYRHHMIMFYKNDKIYSYGFQNPIIYQISLKIIFKCVSLN